MFFPETYRLDHQWDQTFTVLQSQTTLVNGSFPVEDADKTNTTAVVEEALAPKIRFNPFRSFLMLKYVFVCFVAIEIGFCFGTMFTLETLIPDLYYEHYGFDSWQTGKIFVVVLRKIADKKNPGLSFIGAGVGNVLGSIVSGRLSDYLLIRSSNQRGGISKAEDRLTLNAWY